MRHKVTKCPSGIEGYYVYRGITIRRGFLSYSKPGYWGWWSCRFGGKSHSFTTRAETLRWIDQQIDTPKEA
jgi:hypothetical protein